MLDLNTSLSTTLLNERSDDMTDTTNSTEAKQNDPVIPPEVFLPFALVTTLFALWGFANDVTNPLVKAFKEIFLISNAQSSLVQWAFYGGYATMAIPAALVIRKVSYKSGIIIGLLLYAIGALLTIPASLMMDFNIFLVGFYVLTFGLAFLETTANPYILSMGPRETATQRLNLAQAFNPIGSLSGMIVASVFISCSGKAAWTRSIACFSGRRTVQRTGYRALLAGERQRSSGMSWN